MYWRPGVILPIGSFRLPETCIVKMKRANTVVWPNKKCIAHIFHFRSLYGFFLFGVEEENSCLLRFVSSIPTLHAVLEWVKVCKFANMCPCFKTNSLSQCRDKIWISLRLNIRTGRRYSATRDAWIAEWENKVLFGILIKKRKRRVKLNEKEIVHFSSRMAGCADFPYVFRQAT